MRFEAQRGRGLQGVGESVAGESVRLQAIGYGMLLWYCAGMDIAISGQIQERIRRKVESGMYSSADDVLASALALLDERDDDLEAELSDMREKVRTGLEESKAGLAVPASEVFDELRRRNAEIVRERR